MNIKKLIRKYKRRRDWKKLTERQKQIFRSLGISPKQLEEKEKQVSAGLLTGSYL